MKEIYVDLDEKPIKNLKDVFDFIKDCIERHQHYADTPHLCTQDTGSIKFHQDCVDRYREILKVLKEQINDK